MLSAFSTFQNSNTFPPLSSIFIRLLLSSKQKKWLTSPVRHHRHSYSSDSPYLHPITEMSFVISILLLYLQITRFISKCPQLLETMIQFSSSQKLSLLNTTEYLALFNFRFMIYWHGLWKSGINTINLFNKINTRWWEIYNYSIWLELFLNSLKFA